MKDEDVKSAHLPHISLRRWAGIGPRMSTTSPPYLSCSFRLFNIIDKGLFTYYVSQKQGFLHPPLPPPSAMVSIWLTPLPPPSAMVSI